ncbi:hypothetical protein GLYMA_02G202751v4 [Glycine max]|nr:hypothetical protein GLYMA_02G202751v4 [Glycine max]KAH1061271.1 hypothetical protein GYH30_004657 [Glycine max]
MKFHQTLVLFSFSLCLSLLLLLVDRVDLFSPSVLVHNLCSTHLSGSDNPA